MRYIYAVFYAFNINLLLFLLCLTFASALFINLFDFSMSVRRIKIISNGEGILDMKFYYTAEEAYYIIDSQQQSGRKAYKNFLLFFDTCFPLLYAVAFSALLAKVFLKTFPETMWMHYLIIVPFIVAIFDYLENFSIIAILVKYPKRIWIANIAGYFTACKWLFALLGISLLLFGTTKIFIMRQWF
jgi:hypothetical protein